jgi:hypothetical protein
MTILLKYLILFWSIFVLFSVLSDGGAPIRDAEDNAQTMLSKTLNAFANQADNIKDQADTAKEKIKSITGMKKTQKQ